MILTDTHTHLYSSEFEADISKTVEDALRNGVERFFLPNVDSASIQPMLTLTDKYPSKMYAMMGLHPCSVKENYAEEIILVEEWLIKRKFYAVGEIGIDLFWDKTFLKEQQLVFKKQIQLALQYDLPIVIHSRESFNEVFEIVKEMNTPALKGVFHCFTGSLDEAEKIIGLGGFKMGIGGVLTFKNSGLEQTVEKIDLKHLVLETDSPYLAPVPYRGKRNESAYILLIAQKLAAIKKVSVKEIADITTENSKTIFGI